MRLLNRNLRVFKYANYLGKTLTENGEYIDTYSEPQFAAGNISVPHSDVLRGVEGTDPTYDKVLLVKGIEVNENTVFFIDNLTKYDYVATRVQPSLNHIRVELTKVHEN